MLSQTNVRISSAVKFCLRGKSTQYTRKASHYPSISVPTYKYNNTHNRLQTRFLVLLYEYNVNGDEVASVVKWSQRLNPFYCAHISPMHRTKNVTGNSIKDKASSEELATEAKWWRPLPLLSESELFEQQPSHQWSELGARERGSNVLPAPVTPPRQPSPISVKIGDRATSTQPANFINTTQRKQRGQSPKKRKGAQNMSAKRSKRYTEHGKLNQLAIVTASSKTHRNLFSSERMCLLALFSLYYFDPPCLNQSIIDAM